MKNLFYPFILSSIATLIPIPAMAADPIPEGTRLKSELKSQTPDSEVLHIDIDKDGRPDVIERWWNGKRVRWLDESNTMKFDDERGNMINCILQVDYDGNGYYDGPTDINTKWCDTNNDGIPDVQSFSINPKQWGVKKGIGFPIWMVLINHDKRGVMGWLDYEDFDFDCYDYTGRNNWLPNYHGNNDFVKTHAPQWSFSDPETNWENPFSFYDETGDGVSKLAIRWCAPVNEKDGVTKIPPKVNMVQVAWDLDANSGYGYESSYDMSIAAFGAEIDISHMKQKLPNFKGNPKFDPFFQYNQWRRLDQLTRMDRDKGYGLAFSTPWKQYSFVFDEDADDQRWERVELMWATTNNKPAGKPTDMYSTARNENREKATPGLNANDQSDSLGDRGEFDQDGSGGGQFYVGRFDRKIHLYGAEWGAWTVDKNAEFHGGKGASGNKPTASKVEEIVKYTDTDSDGFIDTIEYDYKGTGKPDFKVCLLDYKKEGFDPQKADIIDPQGMSWRDMHEFFKNLAQESWIEALEVYRAAWKRGLTNNEINRLSHASSMRQRHLNAYWIKEGVFRQLSKRVHEEIEKSPHDSEKLKQYLKDYVKAYYTGNVSEMVDLIGRSPTSTPVVLEAKK